MSSIHVRLVSYGCDSNRTKLVYDMMYEMVVACACRGLRTGEVRDGANTGILDQSIDMQSISTFPSPPTEWCHLAPLRLKASMMVLCGRSLEAYLKVILPRHVGITTSLIAINSLPLRRRRQVIDTMAGSSLPVLHLADG